MKLSDYPGKFLYDNGLPFSTQLAQAIDGVTTRIKNNKVAGIVIDGASGEGKTTLGIEIASYVQGYYTRDGEWINYEEQFSMGGKDFKLKIRVCVEKKHIVILYDEAGDFSNRNFASHFNKVLDRIFETFRTFKILVILLLPLVSDLDNGLFKKGVIRLTINCHNRNDNYGKIRVYGLWRTFYLKEKMKKLTCPREAYRYVKPNFRAVFKNIPRELEKQLDTICAKGKIDILDVHMMNDSGLIDYDGISEKLDKSKDWVKRKISSLQIKESKKFNRKKYFKAEIIETLREEIVRN